MRVTVLAVALVVGCASACSTGVDGTPRPTPPPAAAPSGQVPGQVLDLTNWNLTLPTGSPGEPDTVEQPALATYSSPFFQVDAGGVVFTSDAGGVTTKGSTYPRSELREKNGAALAKWSNRRGTHTLEVRQAVTALPPAKPEVVTAQIHNADDDVIEIRLEDNRLIAQYGTDDEKDEFVLDPAYVLGTPYDLRITAAAGRVDVFYNGAHSGGAALAGDDWYFKTGSYLQSNVSKGDAPDAVGKVVLYALRVSHTG